MDVAQFEFFTAINLRLSSPLIGRMKNPVPLLSRFGKEVRSALEVTSETICVLGDVLMIGLGLVEEGPDSVVFLSGLTDAALDLAVCASRLNNALLVYWRAAYLEVLLRLFPEDSFSLSVRRVKLFVLFCIWLPRISADLKTFCGKLDEFVAAYSPTFEVWCGSSICEDFSEDSFSKLFCDSETSSTSSWTTDLSG